jgi:hypothetical protein
VLIGTSPKQYYFRGDGGAVIKNNDEVGTKITTAKAINAFRRNTVAERFECVMVYPQTPGYKAERALTLGEFYVNEIFRELWFIPLQSLVSEWVDDEKKGITEPGSMTQHVLSTMLIRGQSRDEFNNLLQPLEEQAFMEWQVNSKELAKKYKKGIHEYMAFQMGNLLNNAIYTAQVVEDTSNNGTRYYLKWDIRQAESGIEKDICAISQIIGKEHSSRLVLDFYEKAALKAASPNGVVPALPAS